MTSREALDNVLRGLNEDQLQLVADFAIYLRWRHEAAEWGRFGREQLARAYGPDEPDYSTADLKDESGQ